METITVCPDIEALTELPNQMVWCERQRNQVILRQASWSYQSSHCARGGQCCLYHQRCFRVVQALNRPGH